MYAETPEPPWPSPSENLQRLAAAIEEVPDPRWRTILQQCWGLAGDTPDLRYLHVDYFYSEDHSRLELLRDLRYWRWVIDEKVRETK